MNPRDGSICIAHADDATFENCTLKNVTLKGSFQRTTFNGGRLEGIEVPDTMLENTRFENLELINCTMNTNLDNAIFKNIMLQGGNWSMARLGGAQMTLNQGALKTGEHIAKALHSISTIDDDYDALRIHAFEQIRARAFELVKGADEQSMARLQLQATLIGNRLTEDNWWQVSEFGTMIDTLLTPTPKNA